MVEPLDPQNDEGEDMVIFHKKRRITERFPSKFGCRDNQIPALQPNYEQTKWNNLLSEFSIYFALLVQLQYREWLE